MQCSTCGGTRKLVESHRSQIHIPLTHLLQDNVGQRHQGRTEQEMLHDQATAAVAAEGADHLLHTGAVLRDVEDRVADLAAIALLVHDPALEALHVNEALQTVTWSR